MSRIAIVLLIIFVGSCETTDPTCIYISPHGNDNNSGTNKNPIKSLHKAQEILLKYKPQDDVVIKISSDKGCYLDQYIDWHYSNPNYSITFESNPRDRNAVFISESDSISKRFFVNRTNQLKEKYN
jgi:hypothetical protein